MRVTSFRNRALCELWLVLGILFSLILCSSACGTRIHIPRPGDPVTPSPPVPDVGESILDVPIEVPLKTVIDEAEKRLPAEQAEEDNWQDGGNVVGHANFQYKYHFWREPFQVTGSGSQLFMSLSSRYRIRGRIHPSPINLEGSCGYDADPPKRLNLRLNSDVSWATSYSLSSRTTVQPLLFLDPCRVTSLNIDATPVMKYLLQQKLENVAVTFDQQLPQLSNFRPRALTTWNQLAQPLEITPELWLELNVSSLRAGALAFSSDNELVTTSIGMVARPRLIAGPKPTPNTLPLPDLSIVGTPSGRLRIPFEADFPFVQINKVLNKELMGSELVLTGDKKVKITSAQLYASGPNAVLAIGIKGSVKGTVYFIGRPVFDTATQAVKFEDVDFTLGTKNILAKVAAWLLHEKFVTLIKQRAVIAVGEDIKKTKDQLTGLLNRNLSPQITIRGSISDLRPLGIFVTDRSLRAQVVAEGEAKIIVK
jgi:hypothetical protein